MIRPTILLDCHAKVVQAEVDASQLVQVQEVASPALTSSRSRHDQLIQE